MNALPRLPEPVSRHDLLWIGVAVLVIVGTGLGCRDPWPADEPRFAAIARDMVDSGNWLFPRVGGDLYQDKPPLFFWMLAACYYLFGSIKASFLIPAFLATCGVCILLYDLGRRLVSRTAGLAASILVLCTLQFTVAMRGAQIDPVLCFFTTLGIYGLCRHLLLGSSWGWYSVAGFSCGLGVITKGVGFLPLLMLLPFFLLRRSGWHGLAPIEAGRAGWRWWLAPMAMLAAISLWFIPMLIGVARGAPEYIAYRDEILFKQTVGRYAAAWHHVKGWHYFILEVMPVLWFPWSVLLFWLAPRFKNAWRDRDARVWLPLAWVVVILVFFSASPGKRGIYIMPALPALALASLPFLEQLLARRGVRLAGFIAGILIAAAAFVVAILLSMASLPALAELVNHIENVELALFGYFVLCASALMVVSWRKPVLAWPVTLGSLTLVFSFVLAPAMNAERSASAFTAQFLAQLRPGEQLGLAAYKEQFLLYLDRPTINFGHRRWQEGEQESLDASAWLNAGEHRVLLMPEKMLKPCFEEATFAGESSDDDWYLVRGRADTRCADRGDLRKAIRYARLTRR